MCNAFGWYLITNLREGVEGGKNSGARECEGRSHFLEVSLPFQTLYHVSNLNSFRLGGSVEFVLDADNVSWQLPQI